MAAISAITELWRDNPVLTKEMRVRMRGARAYWILTGYLAFLSFVLFFMYTVWWNEVQARQGGASAGSKIGQEFFYWIALVQAFLVAFITPAITSGAITIEKEQRTLEMLEMTRLSRVSIIAGKLFAAISFVGLLLISSLPITSICFFLGGVSPEQVAMSYSLMFAGSFVAGALGLVWSTIARTTAASVILTYSTLLVIPVLFLVLFGTLMGGRNGQPWAEYLSATSAMGLYGAKLPWVDMMSTPVSGFYTAWDQTHFFGLVLPVWVLPVLTFGLIGLMLASIATVRLETFAERKGWVLRGFVVAIFLQQMFFYFGARFFVFTRSAPPGLASSLSPYPLLSMLTYPVLLLLLCVPVYSTGEVSRAESRGLMRYVFSGWNPAQLRRNKLNSGLPFLCLLAAVVIGMYALSFVFIGQPRAIMSGDPDIAGVAKVTPLMSKPLTINGPNGVQVVRPGIPIQTPPPVGRLPQFVLSLGATLIGMCGLGLLFSVATRNRWVALILSYATLFIIFIVPVLLRASYMSDPDHVPPGIFINLFYLNPMIGLAEMTDTPTNFWNQLPLLLGQTPMWQVTTISWLLIAGFSYLLAIPFATRNAARPVLPGEERIAQV